METTARWEYGNETESRRPIVELLLLAAPTVAQMGSYTVMQFIDTLMLSHVGTAEATAGGNSGMFAFSVISFGVGVLFVVNTLVSQSFGRKDYAACGRYLWQGIWFSLLTSLLLVPVLPFAPRLFQAFGHEPRLVAEEARYFQIVLAAAVAKMGSVAMGQFLLATDRPNAVTFATICGVCVNAIAAWAMIFGHFGFPPMGIAGAAWAQNVGVVVEMLVVTFFAMRSPGRQKFHAWDWKPRVKEMRNLIMVGVPSGVQIVADVLAWSLFSMWVMGQFGTRAMAANTYMFRYMVVSFMPAFGIATAVTALVGRYIGRGEPDIAAKRARLGFLVTAAYMLTCGTFFFVGRNTLIQLFTNDPEVLRVGAMLLVFAAVYQFFDALYIVYNGALRGAGDTFVPAVATGLLCWGITVFGGYFVARHWPQFGPAGPWVVATAYGMILGLFIYARFQRGGWRRIHLDREPDADTVPRFPVEAV